jgi:Polyketide cyclase / dehydrase and lipid transport
MAKIESKVTIARPPDEVFGYFLTLDENVPKTNRDIEWVGKTPEGPTEVGTTLRARGKSLGRIRETTMRFTAIVPNEKIEFEGEVGPMRPNCVFIFDQTRGGTLVTFRGDPNPVGPFKLLSPLFTRMGQQVWAKRLARAKTALEAPASSPQRSDTGGESRVQ